MNRVNNTQKQRNRRLGRYDQYPLIGINRAEQTGEIDVI